MAMDMDDTDDTDVKRTKGRDQGKQVGPEGGTSTTSGTSGAKGGPEWLTTGEKRKSAPPLEGGQIPLGAGVPEQSSVTEPERYPLVGSNEEWERAIEGVPKQSTPAGQRKVGNQGQVNQRQEEPIQHSQIASYGQQLQYERNLRRWTEDELAEKLGIDEYDLLMWEHDRAAPNLASRQKISHLLGNNYYLSSDVKATPDGMAIQVRIVQRLSSAQDFTTIISALTSLHTQFWLIQQGRFDDLHKFAETQDRSYVEKANLIIENLSTNSPALITLLTDPATITTIGGIGVTLALALNKVIESLTKSWTTIVETRLATRNKEAEERRRQIEEAVTAITKIIDDLHPGVDPQTRAKMLQDILPKYVECLNRKGRKLDLSPLVICP